MIHLVYEILSIIPLVIMMAEAEAEAEEDYNDDDESSSDELGQIALAFDPDQLSEGDGPLQNGHDYLRNVQVEREKYPLLLYSQPPLVDTNNIEINKTIQPKAESGPDDLKYSSEILQNFRKLRERIEELREQNEAETLKIQNSDDILKLMELGQPPQTSAVINNSQMELHSALEKIADLCEITPNYSTFNTDWVYSLIASLREPIEPDIYSTLRRLARLCIARRRSFEVKLQDNRNHSMAIESECEAAEDLENGSKGKKGSKKKRRSKGGQKDAKEIVQAMEEEEYKSSLLIICIIRHYFGQTDLK